MACYWATHQRPHQTSGSQCCRANHSWVAAAAEHTTPRPKLPVLAVRTTCTCSGSSPSFSKLRAGQAQIARNHLLQSPASSNYFKTHRGICHCPGAQVGISHSLLSQIWGLLTGDLAQKQGGASFTSDILNQTHPCILSGSINHSRCQKNTFRLLKSYNFKPFLHFNLYLTVTSQSKSCKY